MKKVLKVKILLLNNMTQLAIPADSEIYSKARQRERTFRTLAINKMRCVTNRKQKRQIAHKGVTSSRIDSMSLSKRLQNARGLE